MSDGALLEDAAYAVDHVVRGQPGRFIDDEDRIHSEIRVYFIRSLPEKRRTPAAKAESIFSDLTACPKAYPDTNRKFFSKLLKPRPFNARPTDFDVSSASFELAPSRV